MLKFHKMQKYMSTPNITGFEKMIYHRRKLFSRIIILYPNKQNKLFYDL